MDNRVFNVNGANDDDLEAVLKLAFKHGNFGMPRKARGWQVDNEYGLILYSYVSDSTSCKAKEFPVPLDAEEILPIVRSYLRDESTWNNTKFEGWDEDAQHDGHNSKGWRVYCEDWGQVNGIHGTFIAIRPAYAWHGK